MISGVSTPGGVFLGDPAKVPFGVKVRRAIEKAKEFKESFQAPGIDSFVSKDTEFLPILTQFDPEITRSQEVKGSLLFADVPGGRGTIIPGFEGFGFIEGGLTAGEFKLEKQRQAGELPEFAQIVSPTGKVEKEIRLGGTLGVPTEAVIADILATGGKTLQADITSGKITIPGEGEEFQAGAQVEFEKRTGTKIEDFLGRRGKEFKGFGTIPIISGGVELGGLALLSTTPTGSIIAGGLLIGRGSKSIQESLGFKDLTFGQRATGVGLGVLDVGFGLAVGGRGVSQAEGGLLSRQAIKESQKELNRLKFSFEPAEVIGKGGDFKLIKQAGSKEFVTGGLTRQDIKTFSVVTKTSGGGVAIPGARAQVKTQIFDPITGKLIRTTEQFTLGTKFPLDVSTGGQFIPSAKGVKAILKTEFKDLTTVEGTGFIKKKGVSGFTEFDILATGGKLDVGKTGFLSFEEGVTRVGTSEALFKETAKGRFRPSGKLKLDFQTTGTRISRTEKVFTQTGDFSTDIGEQIFTKEGLPIVKFVRKGVRVSKPSAGGFIFESKNVPKLDDLFDIGIEPIKIIKRPRSGTGRTKLDFVGAKDDVFQLKSDFKAPPIDSGRPGGTQLISIQATKVDTFTDTSLISAGAITEKAGRQISIDLVDTSFRPLAVIPGVGRGKGTVRVSQKRDVGIDFVPILDIKPEQAFEIGKSSRTVTRSGLDFGVSTKQDFALASAQAFQRPQKRVSKKAFQDPFTLPTITTGGFAEFREIGSFGGFAFPGIPSLGGTGAPPKRERKRKVKVRKIKPSFTAVTLGIETGLPKTLGGFGISPFAIRGLAVRKRKKSKKKK